MFPVMVLAWERTSSETPIKARLKTFSEFAREYAPPEYLFDQIVQAGSLYTLAARTGSERPSCSRRRRSRLPPGRNDILGADAKKGRVAYFSFENPDDFRLKIMAAVQAHGLTESEIGERILICDARVVPEDMAKLLRKAGGEFASWLSIRCKPVSMVTTATTMFRLAPTCDGFAPYARCPANRRSWSRRIR